MKISEYRQMLDAIEFEHGDIEAVNLVPMTSTMAQPARMPVVEIRYKFDGSYFDNPDDMQIVGEKVCLI